MTSVSFRVIVFLDLGEWKEHSLQERTVVRAMDGRRDSCVVGQEQYTTVRLSLQDIAKSFASPLTEEHAWAILYQLAQKFARQIAGSSSNPHAAAYVQAGRRPEVLISLEGVSLCGDGEIYFKPVRKSRRMEGVCINFCLQ